MKVVENSNGTTFSKEILLRVVLISSVKDLAVERVGRLIITNGETNLELSWKQPQFK